jgi:hypothetical protein
MSNPTRYPNGISTALRNSPFWAMPVPDPNKAHIYNNDFDHYASGDWTTTTTGTGTVALTDGDGGILLLTNSAANGDALFLDKKGESFTFASGYKLAFRTRLKVSDATLSSWVVGLQITDTTPLAVSDGVYFLKSTASTTVSLKVMATSVATTSTVGVCADNTYLTLGFYYDGASSIGYYLNDVLIGTSVTTNMPSHTLTVSFGIQNGEAVAKTMSLDSIAVVRER